jgi:hypothetical protein
MSAWPWMKGQSVAIADPIPPTNDRDDRPAVKELVQEHRVKIDRLREELEKELLYDSTKHDDLWMLRFLLSHKKVKAALKAAKHTLQFRADLKLDEKDIRQVHMGHNFEALSDAAKNYQQCCDPGTFRFVVHDRCVVSYIQWAGFDQPKLLKEVSPDDWLPGFAFITEWTHQVIKLLYFIIHLI